MLRLKKVAVTGSLGSGKTTVCQFFRGLGAYVVSADEIVHRLLSPETAVGQQVVSLLGSEVIQGNLFNRKKIANRVFSHPELLKALEQIIHPAVFDEIDREYQKAKKREFPLFVAEVPLLYEAKREHAFDAVIAVHAPREVCQNRSEEFEQRMMHQLESQEKVARADFVLNNNGSLQQLKIQVEQLYSQLT